MSARDSQIHYSTYEKIIKQTNYFFHQVNMSVQNSCWFINCENMAGLDSMYYILLQKYNNSIWSHKLHIENVHNFHIIYWEGKTKEMLV